MSKRCNIIFDGNYLFYKSMCIANNYSSNKSKKFLSDQEEVNILIRKVATDFVATLRRFQGYHKIIFTKDNHSWRKEYYQEYKANRSTKESNIDWGNMFTAMDEFLEILDERGVIISSQQGAEGDDLMYLWSNLFLEHKTANNIIITGDSDLSQVVDYNDDVFTVIFNNHSKQKKFIAKKGFSNWIKNHEEKVLDVFGDDLDQIFNISGIDLIKTSMNNIELVELDPSYISLFKAICGDDGDNIPSIFSWKNDNDKIKRITKLHAEKLYNKIIDRFDEINMHDLMTNYSLRNFVRVQLQTTAKIKIPQDEWEKNLDRNITLSYLNKLTIPKYIQDDFLRNSKNIDKYNTDSFDRIDLLENTKFEKVLEDTSDVFNILDKINEF